LLATTGDADGGLALIDRAERIHVRAREVLEHAYASIDRDDLDPSLPARIRWLLAEASWPEPDQRPRAREARGRSRMRPAR
jgi:hypothetical protein